MGGLIHIAEVAALLLVTYSLGWAIGFAARRATLRVPAGAEIPAARLELASASAAPVVATAQAVETVVAVAEPVVLEGSEPAVPLAQDRPAAALPPAPAIAPPPAQPIPPEPRVPQPAAPVASVPLAEPALPVKPPEAASEEEDEFVILGRPAVATPSAPVEATPASAPGMAWAGQINGHLAPSHAGMMDSELGAPPAASVPGPDAPVEKPPPSVEAAGTTRAPMVGLPTAEPEPVSPAQTSLPVADPAEPTPEIVVSGRAPVRAVVDHDAMFAEMFAPRAAEPVDEPAELTTPGQEPVPEPALEAPAAAEPAAPPPVAEPAPDFVPSPSEDDAMRAIEGGWSRSRASATPEMTDVAAAVAAAQSAVRQAIDLTSAPASGPAAPAHGFGKPAGLPRPHNGRRDNLRDIEGVSPLDESTLNNLGIYHFEQVAEWTPQEVFWLENHVFARGRIGRESWQIKARDLMNRRPPPSRSARL